MYSNIYIKYIYIYYMFIFKKYIYIRWKFKNYNNNILFLLLKNFVWTMYIRVIYMFDII